MADIGVKMGVSGIAQFKQSMNQAQQSVKTLDAALKLNEKQLQATGDKETYMQQKSKLLQQQIAAQNKVIKEGQQALAAMQKQGVDPASQSFQKMQQQVINAQSALLDMHGDLDSVGQTAEETASKTDKLTESLNGINKKVSFDAVLNGIGKITDGMEAAARKVAALARDVWDTMATAAAWADNENTLAAMYGIDVETLQRMQGASRTIDTSVEAIIKSRQKLKQNMASDSKEIAEAFTQLGVSVGYVAGKHNEIQTFRDWEDVFWDVGTALLNYNDEVERDVIAQKIFGRSWMELMPLFQAGREEYQKTMDDQSIVTQQNVDKLNALDDALQKLDQDYQATKNTILSQLAPAFTDVSGAVSKLLEQVNAYLDTDEGKEKLEALGQAVTDLFEGLTNVDFGSAIETASGTLDAVKDALGWIKDNHTAVETALKGIGGAFLALKAAEVVGGLAQGANALKQLFGGGSKGGASASPAPVASGSPAPVASGSGALLSTAKALAKEALPLVVEDAAVIAAAVAPAVIAQTADYAEAEREREERLRIAGQNNGTDAAFLADAAVALGLQRNGDGEMIRGWLGSIRWGDPAAIEAILTGLQDRQNQQLAELYNTINQYSPTTSDGNNTWNQLQRYWAGEPMDLGAETALLESIAAAYAAELEAMEALKVEIDRQRHGDNLETGIIEEYGAAIETALGEKTETALESALRMFVESGDTEDLLKKLSDGYADAFVQMNDNPQIEALYDNLSEETADKFDQLMQDVLDGAQLDPQATIDLLNQIKNELTAAAEKDAVKVKTEPVLAPNAVGSLQAQLSGLGSFQVSVNPVVSASADGSHANGLPFVPFDGYIAALHKGERVVPANQNKNYSATSNLFVESMYMNNGTDAQGLAAAIAAENRRIQSGFGS